MKELLNETMTRAAHELDMARLERANRRLWITLILVILLLVGTNGYWIYYENQFEDEVTTTTTVTQDVDSNDGGDAIINDGVKINGESKTNSNENN